MGKWPNWANSYHFTSVIILAEEDNTYAKFGAGQNFYCLPTSTTTTFVLSSHLHHYHISIVFPSSTTTAFLLSSLLHHQYISIVSLLHHHYISIVFPPPPPLHFHCLSPFTITTFLLSSLLNHHYISTVFPPPPRLHFYCLSLFTITLLHHQCLKSFLHHHHYGVFDVLLLLLKTRNETSPRFFQVVCLSCLTFRKNESGEWSSLDRLAWKPF